MDETTVFRSICRGKKLDTRQIKILSYSLGFDLSNKILETIILCQELDIFNEKVEVLFVKNRKLQTFL